MFGNVLKKYNNFFPFHTLCVPETVACVETEQELTKKIRWNFIFDTAVICIPKIKSILKTSIFIFCILGEGVRRNEKWSSSLFQSELR